MFIFVMWMRCKQLVLIGLVVSLWLSACAAPAVRISVPAPTRLPHTTRQMQTPGFWISRHPSPDSIFFDDRQIAALNRHIQQNLKGTVDILEEKALRSGLALTTDLKKELSKLRRKPFFSRSGEAISPEWLDEMKLQMNYLGIGEQIPVRYGVITCFSDQRILPTDEPIYSEPGDSDFDVLQNSALDLGTPVRILHETVDGSWCYVQSELSGGWIRTEAIARCGREDALAWFRPKQFVVVTRAKADIFLTPKLTGYHETVRMGVCLPLVKHPGQFAVVTIPLRNAGGDFVSETAYVRASTLHRGFLDATPDNIIQQAFELLNAPYGWGGMYGEQDCSRFIQEVLATVGIRMPRNSSDQAKVGQQLAAFSESVDLQSRYDVLMRHAAGGMTLLYLKGHIMLYLGQVDDRHYVIHSTYAYRIPFETMDRTIRINRVAVSDLSLGQGSKRGSLADRLVSVRKLSANF
ncbi:MAG: SH3 domain-containing protein [Desulfatirhabdiaceae bacterium]